MTLVRTLGILIAAISCPEAGYSQDRPTTLRVVAESSGPVAHALVFVAGTRRVTDEQGTVVLERAAGDSIRIQVRRIGYSPFDGWIQRLRTDTITLVLAPLAQQLDAVAVTAERDTPLARTGFYRRIELARRGGFSAEFYLPEDLEQTRPTRMSDLVAASRFARIDWIGGRPVLRSSRRACMVSVLLDGHVVRGTVEEIHSPIGMQQMRRDYLGTGPQEQAKFLRDRLSINDIVPAAAVSAVEVYASANSAPIEIQRAAGAEACAIVAIWTGARQ